LGTWYQYNTFHISACSFTGVDYVMAGRESRHSLHQWLCFIDYDKCKALEKIRMVIRSHSAHQGIHPVTLDIDFARQFPNATITISKPKMVCGAWWVLLIGSLIKLGFGQGDEWKVADDESGIQTAASAIFRQFNEDDRTLVLKTQTIFGVLEVIDDHHFKDEFNLCCGTRRTAEQGIH
jgi:hypothetical protein